MAPAGLRLHSYVTRHLAPRWRARRMQRFLELTHLSAARGLSI